MKKSKLNLDVLDDFPIGITVDDKNNRVIWANKKALNELNLSKEEFKKPFFYQIFGKEDSEISIKENKEIFETGKPKLDLIQYKNLNDKFIWYKIDKIPLTNDDGQVEDIIVFSYDITDHINDIRERVDSESKFRNLFETSPSSIMIIDSHGIILDCNQKTAELLNLKVDEIVGKRLDELGIFDKTQKKRITNYIEALITGKQIDPIEVTINLTNSDLTKNKIVELYGSLLNRENVPYAFQIIARDLTEKFQFEKELRESQELFLSFMENFSGIAFIKDNKSRYLYVNKSYENLVQKTKDELVGKNVFEIWNPEFAESLSRNDKEVLEKRISMQFIEQPLLNSERRTYLTMKFPIFKDEKLIGVAGIGVDVSEQKKIEKLLRTQRDFGIELSKRNDLPGILRLFVDTAIEVSEMDSGGINIFDSDSEDMNYQTGFTNEYISCILKYYPNSKAIGLAKTGKSVYWNYDDLKNLNNEDYEKEDLHSIAIIPLKLESSVIGCLNLASHTLNKISEVQKNSLESLTSHIEEVIGRIKVQEQKERLQKEIMNSQKLESLGILTGGIAHDFNNILTAILGNISLAEISTDKPEELEYCLLEAKKALTRAKDLTQQLLTFSKGGAPIKRLASTSVISDLLKETTNFILRGSRVRCDFEIDEDLWSVEVDEGQISQVINNLVINAIQAMPEGGVVKLKAENIIIKQNTDIPLSPGNYIKINLKDHGIGIPEKYVSKIFDPYFTTKEKGSGLGLATSYSIIKRHGGYFKVESEVGVGTTFNFFLPASPDKISFNIPPDVDIKTGTGRILIMDDENSILMVSKKILERLGYIVETTDNGDIAFQKYKLALENGNKFDLVIMDLTIPGGMGGRELINKLKNIDPNVKAIVSSGYSTAPIMANYEKYGFKAVITKPYKIEEISQIVEKVLNERD